MTKDIFEKALDYHRFPRPGKISILPTKSLSKKQDLALAYSPGVAAACEAIVRSPLAAMDYTTRGNLVAVISNGTAVLGLGNIGPLASKPVMEGKAVLFKKFAGLDVFDLEIQENDPQKLIDIIASLEPTFGGINLEDIKAPECFFIERALQKRLGIPVFHDDQHGTAIVVASAVLNSLKLVNKRIEDVKLITSGAGAAAIACIELLIKLGMQKKNITLTDLEGVIYHGRPNLNDATKINYAIETQARTLSDITQDADIFLGLSVGNVLKEEMIVGMAPNPIILALANPTPEILPEVVRQVRPDAIIATGRSDYPNQINNVLCFPFIFRGALDVGATSINDAMKLACVHALAKLVHEPAPGLVHEAYPDESLLFGPDYIIPKPFDPRLLTHLAPPVAVAAMHSGVATKTIADIPVYKNQLIQLIHPETGAFAQTNPNTRKASHMILISDDQALARQINAIDQSILNCSHSFYDHEALDLHKSNPNAILAYHPLENLSQRASVIPSANQRSLEVHFFECNHKPRFIIVANPNHLDDWIDFTQKIIAPFDSSVALCTSNTDLLSALRARNCNAVSAPPSLDLDDTPFQSATTFLVTSAEEAEAFSNLITSFELGLRKAIFIATKSEQWLLLSKNVTSSEIFDITSLTAS
jgi:malic enzyme